MSAPPSDPAPLLAHLRSFLGPHTSHLPASVTYRTTPCPSHPAAVLYLTLRADTALTSLSTGALHAPSAHLAWTPAAAHDAHALHFLGFQCSEFALPVRASSCALAFDFFSRPGFVRPRSVLPLLVMRRHATHCLMLAPVDAFHEQALGVCGGDLRWGWSGDLDQVPPGFEATLAVIVADSPRAAMDVWGGLVRARAERVVGMVNRKGRYADVSVAKLSMWTDNGAAYWYRREKGMDLPASLEATLAVLDRQRVPVASVELDSWFYTHEVTREVADVGYPNVVPPTGMLRWEPREDVLGEGGIGMLRARLRNRPLILHSRHISSKSGYLSDPSLAGEEWWVDRDRAHPAGSRLFSKWMQQAADWGATAYEQDWLVEGWLGVRQLRERPARVAEWQRQLDVAAKEHNISLIWCMATAADMAQAVSLEQIVALRSCDDYRYAKDPSVLWEWHLTVSCLIRALGLLPFKDVFMTLDNGRDVPDIDGDPHAMLEACLSALSAGPVGIGDRLGRTDSELVNMICRSDGTLIKPDVPLAALDKSLRDPSESLYWAETNCGAWRYVVAIRMATKAQGAVGAAEQGKVTDTLDLDHGERALVYDWKAKSAEVAKRLEASLRVHEWKLWVVCPIVGDAALIGDAGAFVTMGDRRIRMGSGPDNDSEIAFEAIGAHNESVELKFWCAADGLQSKHIDIPAKGWAHCCLKREDGKLVLVSS